MWMIRLRPSGFHERRRVLDEVVADADHEVGPVEARQDVVARLEPDGHQREVRPVVDRALAHERRRDRDVQAAGEARAAPARRSRRSTPLPARTIGRSEAAIRSAAWAIASSVGSGK